MPSTPDDIMEEIYNHGTVAVGFVVYEDFLDYTSGIYSVTSDVVAGGHAVDIVGWDHDGSNKLYWRVKNQWGTTFGESGYFNIYAGESGLDAVAFGCDPDLS